MSELISSLCLCPCHRVFWRSCSFILGAVLQSCFKDEANLHLHSFPSPNVKSGSFVHDIFIEEQSWAPTKDELRTISAEMVKLAAKNLKIERLDVSIDLALEMFQDNPYKKEQLPSIQGSTSSGKLIHPLFPNAPPHNLRNAFFYNSVV